MKKYTVLVTGVGAIIGYGIIKSLRESRYNPRIIGIDIFADAAGREWCDHFEQGVPAASEKFPGFLSGLIERHGIDLVIPGIEQDIGSIAGNLDELSRSGAIFAINRQELLDLFHDKWDTHRFLVANGIEAIPSCIDGSFGEAARLLGLPMLMKPRRSYASKGIQVIESQADFEYWKRKLGDNFMVQEIIGDESHEYTISAFGLGDGTFANMIMLNRRLSTDGSTAKASTCRDGMAEELVGRLCALTQPVGPTNFQARLHRNRFYLLEVNPRVSSATSIRQAFGVNEAEMCIEYFLENKRPAERAVKNGRAVRYIADAIYYDSVDR